MEPSTDTSHLMRAAVPELTGRIEKVREGHVLAFDEQLDYPRPYIWELLTSPPKVEQWLGRLEKGLQLGKEYTLHLDGAVVSGTVLQFDPPTKLQYTWEDEFGLVSIVEFRVLPCGDGTLIQVRMHPETDEFLTEGAAGWQLILDGLRAAAAGTAPRPGPSWAQLRDEYGRRFSLSQTMGVIEQEDGVEMFRFDRRYEAPLLLVNDAITADPEEQPLVELTEVDLTVDGEATAVTVRMVIEDRAALPKLMAHWHAHLDDVAVNLAGAVPHRSEKKLHALEDFYRRNLAG